MIAMLYSSRKDLAIGNNDCTKPSFCTECSQHLYTDLGIKLHRESHSKYDAFIGNYEKVRANVQMIQLNLFDFVLNICISKH